MSCHLFWQRATSSFSTTFQGAGLGCSPDGQAEGNLVHKVSQVINQVEHASFDATHQVPKEVTQRVDGPTNRHDEAHGLEGGLHVLVHGSAASYVSGLTRKDLEQDVGPPGQAQCEAQPSAERTQGVSLTTIAKCQHSNCANHQPPEHA